MAPAVRHRRGAARLTSGLPLRTAPGRCIGRGPGSFGIAVPALGLNATRGHILPPAGRVALVSQSAALCRAVLDWAGPNGIGFSYIIGVGGNADLGFAAALDWLAADPGTDPFARSNEIRCLAAIGEVARIA